MEELLSKVNPIVELAALALSAIVLLATIVAKFTPTKKDDELISKGYAGFLKFIAFLPTIGINPNTKKMQEVIAEYKAKEAAQQESNKTPPAA